MNDMTAEQTQGIVQGLWESYEEVCTDLRESQGEACEQALRAAALEDEAARTQTWYGMRSKNILRGVKNLRACIEGSELKGSTSIEVFLRGIEADALTLVR